jgi:hypothetical protein
MSDSRSELERNLESGLARFNPETGEVYATTSWASVDLEPYKRGERVIAPPKYLRRDDGRALIYPGRPHVFYGPSESLKSWAALLACADVIGQGDKCVYVDFEGSEAAFVERARLAGVPEGSIGRDLRYVRPNSGLYGDAQSDFWHHEMDVFEPSLVVMDGVTECYSLHGWDINRAEDAAKYQATFAFHRGGVASIAIDHTSKDAGRGQLGSQHKRAGLDGAEYEFKLNVAAGRGRRGFGAVSVTKDRHGYVREWAKSDIGYLVVDTSPDAALARRCVSLEAAKLSDLVNPESDVMERVCAYLQEHPDGSSRNGIAGALGVHKSTVGEALVNLQMLGRAVNRGTTSRTSWVAAS